VCQEKEVTIYGGLGLSGCAGDCEGCEGRGGGASRRLKCFGVPSILAKSGCISLNRIIRVFVDVVLKGWDLGI
jgi:hypothetical protein